MLVSKHIKSLIYHYTIKLTYITVPSEDVPKDIRFDTWDEVENYFMNMVVEMDLPLSNIEWNEIAKAKFIKELLSVNLVENISQKNQ